MKTKAVRIPQQKRSIEKKEKIIEAAALVFKQNGYFGTNTAEIAKAAGLSTGSIYAYFSDKKDILLACLAQIGNKLIDDICSEIDGFSVTDDVLKTTVNAIRVLIKFHDGQSQLYHNEIKSLQYRDEDIKNHFKIIQKSMIQAITNEIEAHGYTFARGQEQTFLLYQMVEGIQDELTFENTPGINHEVLVDECARIIVTMLKKNTD
jgi:TetR/AcrR family transcriptional regulator, biofilm operon repressor